MVSGALTTGGSFTDVTVTVTVAAALAPPAASTMEYTNVSTPKKLGGGVYVTRSASPTAISYADRVPNSGTPILAPTLLPSSGSEPTSVITTGVSSCVVSVTGAALGTVLVPCTYATTACGAERALPSLAAYSRRSYSSGYLGALAAPAWVASAAPG